MPVPSFRSTATRLRVVVLALLALGGCASRDTVPSVEELSSELTSELLAEGHETGVVECVVDLAQRRFRSGELDAVTRDELVRGCTQAREVEVAVDAPPPTTDSLAFTEPIGRGDDPALDALWDRCAAGSGAACDELFAQAPLGSDYETFGLTCGERDDVLDCAELDAPAETETETEADAEAED